jgi:nicotinamide mononucleotide transporter
MADEILQTFLENLRQTQTVEYIAVLFGLLSVWYARKVSIITYPTGIVSVLLYVYICLGAGLYADMGINVVYFVMSVYGWYFWSRKSSNMTVTPITRLKRKGWIISIGSTVLSFLLLYYVLDRWTDSNVPAIDAFTTAVFIVGMFLMARKKLENWLAWIVGDIISIPLYAYKGLVMSSFQFTVFLILAIAGYIEWRRTLKQA